ncbi:MAG: hypothetical protein FWE37_02855 [Spirochaetaceae bacterium]|nr:hypothetical protein [Spirochaetaceae bacterium]
MFKKLIIVLLIAIASLGLVACAQDNDNTGYAVVFQALLSTESEAHFMSSAQFDAAKDAINARVAEQDNFMGITWYGMEVTSGTLTINYEGGSVTLTPLNGEFDLFRGDKSRIREILRDEGHNIN